MGAGEIATVNAGRARRADVRGVPARAPGGAGESLAAMRGGLVVSCQAPDGDPMHGPAAMTAMARAAVLGGAVAIRANGPADVAAIRAAVDVPVIGLCKVDLPDSPVRITPTLALALALAEAGADVIAVDATARPRPESLETLVPGIRERTGLPVLADVATADEAVAAVALGADAVSTTMSGYTGAGDVPAEPDLALVARLAAVLDVPVIAEGRVTTPEQAATAIALGAHAVVVGTAITRPEAITRRFATAIAAARPVPATNGGLAVAIDIGGTKIAAALVDAAGTVTAYHTAATPASGGSAVVAAAVSLAKSAIAAAPAEVVACGVATAGEVDAEGAAIVSATAALAGWAGMPLAARLREGLGLPVVVENDANAAAAGEARRGAGVGASCVVAVTVGTGIGGGIWLRDGVHRGSHGIGGGVGHLVVRAGGRACPCGARGCIEAYASGPAISARFAAAARRAGARVDERADRSLDEIAALARSADTPLCGIARRSIDAAARDLGAVLGGLVNAVDPDVVVLGGGVVAGLGERFVDGVRTALRRQALPPARHVVVAPAALGPRAPLVGAGLLALDAFAAGASRRSGARPVQSTGHSTAATSIPNGYPEGVAR